MGDFVASSFLYSKLCAPQVRGWAENVSRFLPANFQPRRLLLPINHASVHWSLLLVDVTHRRMTHYDSLRSPRRSKEVFDRAERLSHFFDGGMWLTDAPAVDQQVGGVDCGVFCCQFAANLLRDAPLTFSQADVDAARAEMAAMFLAAVPDRAAPAM